MNNVSVSCQTMKIRLRDLAEVVAAEEDDGDGDEDEDGGAGPGVLARHAAQHPVHAGQAARHTCRCE